MCPSSTSTSTSTSNPTATTTLNPAKLGSSSAKADSCCSSSDLESVFGIIDADGDGKIEAGDLHKFLSGAGAHGFSTQDIHDMIHVADSNRDGIVDIHDFQSFFSSSSSSSSSSAFASPLRSAFDVIDADGDGIVTVADLQMFFRSVSAGDFFFTFSDDDISAMMDIASPSRCSGSSGAGVRYEDFVRLVSHAFP